MSELARIGVAINEDLPAKFDNPIEKRGYTNRSEAFRDLIRNELAEHAWQSSDAEMCGTVTLVYDHHVRMPTEKLTELQHKYHSSILSSMHVHLDRDNCLEVVLVRGKAAVVQKPANGLIAIKGVKHGKFTAATAADNLP
jgi:CopG family nickel-responsive transcriptional regulator